jgi:signal transduction histidine kinase
VTIFLGRDGERLVLLVRDNGCGMTEAERSQAFEPFFTTRAAGEGAGLGLAIAASIIHTHGGEIMIQSAPGEGTEVTVRLPLDDQRSDPKSTRHSEERGAGRVR